MSNKDELPRDLFEQTVDQNTKELLATLAFSEGNMSTEDMRDIMNGTSLMNYFLTPDQATAAIQEAKRRVSGLADDIDKIGEGN